MTQRDQLPVRLAAWIPAIRAVANTSPLWWLPSIIIAGGRRLHFNVSLGARFAHRFRFAGDIDHMGFTRGVNMGQL